MNYKKISLKRYGGPDVLRIVEETLPPPGKDEISVRILAAGVAFADVMVRVGLYPGVPSPPITPGYDIAGVVESVGPGVKEFKKGAAVVALTRIGGYAEMINVPADMAVRMPGTDPIKTCALVLNYLTAYQMLHRIARVKSGERILIHGAAGGVGTALLQLGSLLKLQMFGTASPGKHDLIRKLGGIPIDYQSEDFVRRVRELTGDGVDAVFDPVGGKNWRRSWEALRAGGKIIPYGFSAAAKSGNRDYFRAVSAYIQSPRMHMLKIFESNRGQCGYSIWDLALERNDWYREDMEDLLKLYKNRKIDPIIAKVFSLADAPKAHDLLNRSGVVGKIMLKVV